MASLIKDEVKRYIENFHALYYTCDKIATETSEKIHHSKAYKVKIIEIAKLFTVFVLVGTCKHLNTTLMVFALLNSRPPHYPRPQNKLDSITQQITGCDWLLISPYSITLESKVMGHKN